MMSNNPHAPSIGHPFVIGVLHLDIRLPGCRSLKEKRGRLARLMNGLRKKHAIVISEVGDQDVWQRAGLAAVTLSGDRNVAQQILDATVRTIAGDGEVELFWHETELL